MTRLSFKGRPRIFLKMCACGRKYLNSPFSNPENAKRGYCELCAQERDIIARESQTPEAIESFSQWLDATGDSIFPDHPEEPLTADEIDEALQMGFRVNEEEFV